MHPPFDFDISRYPALPKLPGVFVTGTDTEVGKTFIAGAIAVSLRKLGLRVEPFKPAASGCRRTAVGLVSEDAEFLAACCEAQRPLAEITPLRYREALAPNVAASRAGLEVDLDAVFRAYARLASSPVDAAVVEGVGGLLCPLANDFWVIHLAKLLDLPVVIVARAGLGTINHTLLTIHAARSAGLHVAGVIINRYALDTPPTPVANESHGDAITAMETNPQQIADRGNVPILAQIVDDPANSVANAHISPDAQYNIDQIDWPTLLGL